MRRLQTQLSLRHVTPSHALSLLLAPTGNAQSTAARNLLPDGITTLSPDDTRGTITVAGEESGIAELEQLLRLLDIKPKSIQLVARFKDARATVRTDNNQPVTIALLAGGEPAQFQVTPHINGDGTLSLLVSNTADQKPVAQRRVRSGELLSLPSGISLSATILE